MRLLFAFPIALAISIAIFIALALLVSRQQSTNTVQTTIVALNKIELKRTPPPIKEPPPMETQAPLTKPPKLAIALPSFDIETKPLTSDITLPISQSFTVSRVADQISDSEKAWLTGEGEDGFEGIELIPIATSRPRYPKQAALEGLEGWVELLFTIDADGYVKNVKVINANPSGVFEAAAISAIEKWVYAPSYRQGQAVRRQATQRISFSKDDILPLYLLEE